MYSDGPDDCTHLLIEHFVGEPISVIYDDIKFSGYKLLAYCEGCKKRLELWDSKLLDRIK